MTRVVAVCVLSRANYGRVKSVMSAIKNHPDLELRVILGASANLERFGNVSQIIKDDGFQIIKSLNFAVEGDMPEVMAKTCGLGIIEMSGCLRELNPDIVITVADRYETMSTAIAASYQNIRLAHIQGGEVTGSIDESVRHAITKLAHIHFPATDKSAENIIKMGEDPRFVTNVGCPSLDNIVNLKDYRVNNSTLTGTGFTLDLSMPFNLVVFHPVTTEYFEASDQAKELLKFVVETGVQTIWLWPNIDAGTDKVSKVLRLFRENKPDNKIRFVKNLPVENYNELLRTANCLIGNSSSFIREASFLGTPAVIVGSRQNMRETGENVIISKLISKDILDAYLNRLHWKRKSDFLYGDGSAGKKIANLLAGQLPNIQKKLCY